MHVLGLERVPNHLVEELATSMAARGRLGVVRSQSAGASVSVRSDFELEAAEATARELLDMLGPRCDFALVCGERVNRHPTLSVEEGRAAGDLLDESMPIDAVDAEAIVEALQQTDPYVTLESLVAQIKQHAGGKQSGAIATFTGRVRAKENPDDTETEYLEFERYGNVAVEEMERIRSELTERKDVHEVLLHHRTGVLTSGEDIVFVVVLAGHREQAFRTVKDGIDRLKAEVPIFKKEVTVDEEFWVHNRP